MYIKRLKLTNFIGIDHGLDRREIELHFDNSKKIIMLSGGNGSGKSTIMSQLHPFKESFDDRRSQILDGLDGRKEIDIVDDNDNLYEIVHIYASIAQSFIKKNGEELNENGGVRSFEATIEKELSLNKEYFKIGKIGSNTKNFIEYTTADRKNYIGTFLDIEEMIEKYNLVRQKMLTLNRDITSIANDIKSYGSKEDIQVHITSLEKELVAIDERLNSLLISKGTKTSQLNDIREKIGEINFDIIEKETELNKLKYQEMVNDKVKYEMNNDPISIEELEPIINELNETLHKLDISLQLKNQELEQNIQSRSDIRNLISKKEIELNSLGDVKDIEKLKNDIKILEESSAELLEKIRVDKLSKDLHNIRNGNKNFEYQLQSFSDFSDYLEKYYSDLNRHSVMNNSRNIDLFINTDSLNILKRNILTSNNLLNDKKVQKASYMSKIDTINLKSEKANKFKTHHDCNKDDCLFLSTYLDHDGVEAQIGLLEEQVKDLNKDIEALNDRIDNMNEDKFLYETFNREYFKMMNNPVFTLFMKVMEVKDISELLNTPLNIFTNERINFRDSIDNNIAVLDEYRQVKQSLNDMEGVRETISGVDSEKIRDIFTEEIRINKEKLIEVETKTQELEKVIGEEIKEVNLIKSEHEDKIKYFTAIKEIDILDKKIKDGEKEIQSYLSYVKILKERESEMAIIERDILNYTSDKNVKTQDLNVSKSKFMNIERLIEKQNNLSEVYKPIEIVSRALSPNNGIPLILIQVYLEQTETIVNELLSIAYNGEFEIQFETGPKDFFIKVRAKDNIKSDIKLASQGEIALTTLSISLALIEQSVGRYNILCLDEIDGPLDVNNRTNFIDILTKQIDKMGVEQTFIISHNNAFDTYEMGLILLKDHQVNIDDDNYMKNKNVIFNIDKE